MYMYVCIYVYRYMYVHTYVLYADAYFIDALISCFRYKWKKNSTQFLFSKPNTALLCLREGGREREPMLEVLQPSV
jgi:hypothetical protein